MLFVIMLSVLAVSALLPLKKQQNEQMMAQLPFC
jgi:hypothetical protein